MTSSLLLKFLTFAVVLQESPNGGIVILKIKKGDNIDKMWEQILFALLGKFFQHLIFD